jgi:RNA polymerase primary sigma factor
MDPRIDRIVEALEDDAFRRGGSVTIDHVLRLAEKNGLGAGELVLLRQRLTARGVVVECLDDDEEPHVEGTQEPEEMEGGVAPVEAEIGSVAVGGSPRDRDLLGIYFRELSGFRLLLPDEEVALFRRIRAGDQAEQRLPVCPPNERAELQRLAREGRQAREAVVNANLRLVPWVAKKEFGSYPETLSQEDLIQEGNLGLLRAVDKFDHTRDLRFSTYAFWWIWSRMKRAIDERGRLVHVPVYVSERYAKVLQTRGYLSKEAGGRTPGAEEVAAHLGWEAEEVQFLLDLQAPPVSLDQVHEETGSSLKDSLAAPVASSPSESVESKQVRSLLLAMVSTLGSRAASVLRRRFGLDDGKERTLEELGAEMNVTRERVRQIEAKALDRLRHPLRAKLLQELFFPADDPPKFDLRALLPSRSIRQEPDSEKRTPPNRKGKRAHAPRHRKDTDR